MTADFMRSVPDPFACLGIRMEVQLSAENTPGTEKPKSKQKIRIADRIGYLERCGYKITFSRSSEKLPPIAVQRMAWKTGEALCDPVVVDFLQFIRTHMQSDGSFVPYPKVRQKIVCHTFRDCSDVGQNGTFAAIVIYPQNIVYELAQNETVRHF